MEVEFVSVFAKLDRDAQSVLTAAETQGGDHPLHSLAVYLQKMAAPKVAGVKFDVYSILVKTSNISKLKQEFPEAFPSSPLTARKTTAPTATPSAQEGGWVAVQVVVQKVNLLWFLVQAYVWTLWQRALRRLTMDGDVMHEVGTHSMWERFVSACRLMTVLVTITLLVAASLCCMSSFVCLLCWILSSLAGLTGKLGGSGVSLALSHGGTMAAYSGKMTMRAAELHVMRRQQAVPLSVPGSPSLSGLRAMLSLPAVHERKIGMAVLQARLDAQSVEIAGLNARMAGFDELVGRVQQQDAEIVRLRMTEANVTMMQAITTHQLMTCIARPAGPPPARDHDDRERVVHAQAVEMEALRRRLEEQAVQINALRRHTDELAAGIGILVLGLGAYLSTSVMSAMGWVVSDWFITVMPVMVGVARPA